MYRHIFTALATYYNLVWLSWLRDCLGGKQDDVVLLWPSIFTSLPLVYRKENLPGNREEKEANKNK